MKTFNLNKVDLVGIAIPVAKNKVLVVDRYGLALWRKYGQNGSTGWRYHPRKGYHRVTGNRRFKTFQRELLNGDFHSTTTIEFINGNKLDLRIINLKVRGVSLGFTLTNLVA